MDKTWQSGKPGMFAAVLFVERDRTAFVRQRRVFLPATSSDQQCRNGNGSGYRRRRRWNEGRLCHFGARPRAHPDNDGSS